MSAQIHLVGLEVMDIDSAPAMSLDAALAGKQSKHADTH
jgi:hypothetical protein